MNEFIKNQNITIAEYDSDLSKHLEAESNRQEEHIELIASENYASKRILEAQGSVLTNKYAEGYPNKRYYGGWRPGALRHQSRPQPGNRCVLLRHRCRSDGRHP